MSTQDNLDPIVLALVQNRLDHISRQMGWVMTRTARSPIFSQSHDFSCFIADPDGTLVSQADGIPIHTGGGGFAVRALLRDFAGDINDGDVFLLNDPYTAGGNHLPDWVIARPVFVGGELVAFACNRAHQADIGGGAAGTYNSEAREIFHEGIRLPVMKLIAGGETRQDIWRLVMINTRTAEALDGDLRAMIGSTKIGADRIAALVDELGMDQYRNYFEGILEHADRSFRRCVAAMPDGDYHGEEAIDNDCFEPIDDAIRVRLGVKGEALEVDFTGTAPQVKGFKNSSVANTWSAVYMALASYFDPDLPRNEGTFRTVAITAPEGTIINARPPAAMTMNTVFVAHEIVHAIWKTLNQALPERSCAGWAKAIHGTTSGRLGSGQEGEESPFVMYQWNSAPGGGAVEGRDGFNQIGHLIALGGLVLPNVETYEQLYPVLFKRQEFRTDAAGPGAYRGGTGADFEVEVKVDAEYAFRGEGLYNTSCFGASGGAAGQPGDMELTFAHGGRETPPKYAVRHFGPLAMCASSPGGGGWGDPKQRDPERVLRDIRDGVVSQQAGEEIYGVKLSGNGKSIDEAATAKLRAS
ncbi:MAG: hydantoinase B/oxoprolinase family protein [Rhodospirillaceae bacterium]|jgi:N-methylhydantoinase B|nr:hydantoinase B/oxoprolinase family protein [Rhodospirillaceae bacterium]MBT3492440.1 hydantoinase B/oxoprolinase family protein [Rhodospirillaceae bacterium]MBT3782918.1 hydantoinase B/oxoprolinase family protein [Rhodospirillaceae bacterium]MBT3977853.1 hydantoinase B/oxoprolinase family protein [Rhodospirillaceae bacterium]MBT4561488.1 hydantoinase B/oxoprolinase family protein [Rhodospirillaceae bacterium]